MTHQLEIDFQCPLHLTLYIPGGSDLPTQTWFPNFPKFPLYLHILRLIDFLCMSGPFTKKLEHPMWAGLNLEGISYQILGVPMGEGPKKPP